MVAGKRLKNFDISENLNIKFTIHIMRREEIIEALLNWNFWGNFEEKIIERKKYLEKLSLISSGKEISVVKGIRRSGKSMISYYYLFSKFGDSKKALIVNLEDPGFPAIMNLEDLKNILKVYMEEINPEYPKMVILDEVQKVSEWERFARFLVESKKVKVIVTGSSSKLMSEEYATLLTGRHLDMEVFPLSFEEFLYFKGLKLSEKIEIYKNRAKILNFLREYLKFGGFPEVVKNELKERKTELLRNYINDIIVKDVVKRFRVKKIEKLEMLIKFLASNISSIFSMKKAADHFDISVDSVERFKKYLEIARLFFFIDHFQYSVKKQIKSRKKVYIADVGFYNVFGFKFSENMGKIIENVVANELIRRSSFNQLIEIYYFRDYQGREVDFVVKEGLNVGQLIQVTYANDRDEINEREIKALLKASEELKCKNLLCITWDFEGEEKIDGKKVKFLPLWKWLLEFTV